MSGSPRQLCQWHLQQRQLQCQQQQQNFRNASSRHASAPCPAAASAACWASHSWGVHCCTAPCGRASAARLAGASGPPTGARRLPLPALLNASFLPYSTPGYPSVSCLLTCPHHSHVPRCAPRSPYSSLMTEENAERLANALCRMRGAALKLGQMLSIQDENVLPPQVGAAGVGGAAACCRRRRVRRGVGGVGGWQALPSAHWSGTLSPAAAAADLQPAPPLRRAVPGSAGESAGGRRRHASPPAGGGAGGAAGGRLADQAGRVRLHPAGGGLHRTGESPGLVGSRDWLN